MSASPNTALQRTPPASPLAPLSFRTLGGRWRSTLFVFVLCLPGPTNSIVTEPAFPPHRNFFVIYYDASYLFGARHYGDSRDFGGNTEPALLVHSKAANCWMQITAVTTQGGKFGRSRSTEISVSWDFTSLAKKQLAELPLRTSGSIDFPDRIDEDGTGKQYVLHFNSDLKIASAETVLLINKVDLEKAFQANRQCPSLAR